MLTENRTRDNTRPRALPDSTPVHRATLDPLPARLEASMAPRVVLRRPRQPLPLHNRLRHIDSC